MKVFFFLKNRLVIVFILFFYAANVWSQTAETPDTKQPQFVGGSEALNKYFEANYPMKARIEGIEGKVVVRLIIEANGEISEAEILEAHYYKSASFSLSKKVKRVPQSENQEPILYRTMNKSILKVIKKMPAWEAGRKDGLPVRMNCVLPIIYELKKGMRPIWIFMPVRQSFFFGR